MKKKVHLIGAGGAGMSAIAKYLYKQGYDVSGSDSDRSENIVLLEDSYGFRYLGDQGANNIHSDMDMIIHTPAVGEGNSEYDKAKVLDIPVYSYPEYLGVISKDKKTIAISGTNGKTTTTTMVGELLVSQGLDPTIIVGGVMQEFNSNYREGDSDLFVVEACEYKHSFLSLVPSILVITNLTPDHMEYFKTFDNYKQTFISLIDKMPTDGILVCNTQDSELNSIMEHAKNRGLEIHNYMEMNDVQLSVPGEYNKQNAQAALTVAMLLGADEESSRRYLRENFKGSKRRFEKIGKTKEGHVVYDDYAHNPEALEMLITGVREFFNDSNIVVFFQPHLFSRTKDLFSELTQALLLPDQLFLLPIYHAREEPDEEISSFILNEAIKLFNPKQEPVLCGSFDDAVRKFSEYKYPKNTVILTVGAGDVWKISHMLVE